MDTSSVLLFTSVPVLFMKETYTEVGFGFVFFLREWAVFKHVLRLLLGFWLLNLCRICLSPFTGSFKNQDFKKKNSTWFCRIVNSGYGCPTNEAYIYFQHVSSPCDRGKHTYFDKNAAIYWLHKVCLIVCTLELMSSSRGDDVLC